MGEVFLCSLEARSEEHAPTESSGHGARVALKTFQRRFFFDNAVRLSFLREATIWLRLSGTPHIMPVLGVEQFGDRPFVMMPAVEPGPNGERTLADLLR